MIRIADIDAFEGTPVLDIKAYMPSIDRVKEVKVPEWMSDWPERLPDDSSSVEPNYCTALNGNGSPQCYPKNGCGESHL